MDLGDILVMPVTGTRARAWDAYRSHFPKDKGSSDSRILHRRAGRPPA